MATVTYSYVETKPEAKLNVTLDPFDQSDPDIAISAGGGLAYLTWTSNVGAGPGADFSMRRVSTADLFTGTQDNASPNQPAVQDQMAIAILSNGDRVTVGRELDVAVGAGGSSIVWAINDLPDETAPKIVGNQSDDQFAPDAAGLKGDRFVIVWADELNGDANNTDVRMSVFNNAGTATIKDSITIASGASNQRAPVVASLDSGGFVVAWMDDALGTGSSRVRARRFDSDGNGVGAVIDVATAGDNESARAIGLADGGFAVVFLTTGLGPSFNIGLRIFNADGAPRTDAIRVDENDATSDFEPVLAQLDNGFITVSWTRTVGGTNNDLYMRTFRPSGTVVTPEFRYDGTDLDSFNERQSTIGALPGGRVMAAWNDSQVRDNGGTHIAGAIYTLQRTTFGDGTDESFVGDGLQDIVFGQGGVDAILGLGNDDQLFGQGGDDAIRGGAGADLMDGGQGNDTVNYATETETVSLALTGATDAFANVGALLSNRDTVRNFENVTGGLNDDSLVGDGLANVLKGEGGKDFLHSHSYEVSGAIKTGAGNDTLEGGDGDDGLFAGDGNDTLRGGDGNDGMVGGAGGDLMEGGTGADFLFGGAFGSGGVRLPGSGADTISGGEGNDGLYGFDGADAINGDAGDDYVEGGAGDDTINGGADNDFLLAFDDNDTLNGGQGFDYLYGGTGGDLFVFRLGDSADWILDFSAAEGDKLRFEGFSFANFAAIPLVDLSTPGNPAVQMNFSGPGGVDQLTIFGATLAQLSAANVSVA